MRADDTALSPVRSMWVRVTWIVLLVALSPVAFLAFVDGLRFQLLPLLLFVLPVALGLAWWLGFRIVRPIDLLRMQVLAKLDAPHPHGDLALPRRDELNVLARAINHLLSRLEAKSRANEEFVRDLTHELKNPIAAIRACVDPLANALDETRARRIAKVLDDSTKRLDAVVSELLEIARADAGMINEARATIDLVALARGIIEVLPATARFEVEAPERLEIEGVPFRIESVLRNLLDNAASFAGAGGVVRVRIYSAAHEAHVVVLDSGPGIPEADLSRVFDRFYTTRGGTGLGLALARAIVEAHGGTLKATSRSGTGAEFEAIFRLG